MLEENVQTGAHLRHFDIPTSQNRLSKHSCDISSCHGYISHKRIFTSNFYVNLDRDGWPC